jgi:hypothetical protein
MLVFCVIISLQYAHIYLSYFLISSARGSNYDNFYFFDMHDLGIL